MKTSWWQDLFAGNRVGVFTGLSFFVFGLFWLIFGFWRSLFLVLLTVVGYWFGTFVLSDPERRAKLIDFFLPPGRFH